MPPPEIPLSTTSTLLQFIPEDTKAAENTGTSRDSTMAYAGSVASAGTDGPPESAKQSLLKRIGNFLWSGGARFLEAGKNIFNNAMAMTRSPNTETPLRMQSKAEAYISETALAQYDYPDNIGTLDGMMIGDHALSDAVKDKMASSPTLMKHMKDFADAGWTLKLKVGEEHRDMSLRERFHDLDKVVSLSADEMGEDPAAFLDAFVGFMMMNKEHMVSSQHNPGDFHLNFEVALPQIRAEIA